ncbi:MAG: hypothetical protein WCA46_09665 [Actinocatenispora sp.]
MRRLAARRGIIPEDLVLGHLRSLLDAEIGPEEEPTPEERRQAAEAFIRRQGIDPGSPEFLEARRNARRVLDEADRLFALRSGQQGDRGQ